MKSPVFLYASLCSSMTGTCNENSFHNVYACLAALLCKPIGSVVASNASPALPSFFKEFFLFAQVIPKNLRHYLKHSKQPFRQRKQDKSLFERCILMLPLLREKRVLLSPMTERKVVCGKFCVTEGCCLQLLNKAQNDCFCSAGRFCNFSRDEKLR